MQSKNNLLPDASEVYKIWPGSGVPSGSEEWNWHEQSMAAPIFRTDVDPPTRFLVIEKARLWGEEDGRQAIRYVRQHAGE